MAVVNCDWDNLCARDLYMIFRLFLPPEGSIVSVAVHPSDYGVRMMQREERHGPDADIWHKNALPPEAKAMEAEANFIDANTDNEEMMQHDKSGSSDEEEEEEEEPVVDERTQVLHAEMERLEKLEEAITAINQERAGDVLEDEVDTVYNKQALRKYELQKLHYYYALVELDSAETADRHTCNVLSLSFVADDFAAPHAPTDECRGMPAHYTAASDRQTNALASTFLELSWDQTDPNRLELCQRAFNEQQMSTMDLVTEFDTDTPDKKVLIKRRARNRYKEILSEFKALERSVKDSADEGAQLGAPTPPTTSTTSSSGASLIRSCRPSSLNLTARRTW